MLTDSTLWDRAFFLLLGIVLGFMLGLTVSAFKMARKAEEEAHETHLECVRLEEQVRHLKGEDGFFEFRKSHRFWGNVGLSFIVVIVAYAAIASQFASNKTNKTVEENQHQTDQIQEIVNELKLTQDCTETIIIKSLDILNQRTDLNIKQTKANMILQEAQHEYLRLVVKQRGDREAQLELFNIYYEALGDFVKTSNEVNYELQFYPIPDTSGYRQCLAASKEEINGN